MLPFAFKQSTHRRLPSARKRSDSQACEFKFRLPQVASSALSSTLHSHFLTLNGRGTTCWEIALVKSASCQLDEKRPFRALEEPRQVRPQGRNADNPSKWITSEWLTTRPECDPTSARPGRGMMGSACPTNAQCSAVDV